jgi:hypothetical protein
MGAVYRPEAFGVTRPDAVRLVTAGRLSGAAVFSADLERRRIAMGGG